jgi:hypothetical protein
MVGWTGPHLQDLEIANRQINLQRVDLCARSEERCDWNKQTKEKMVGCV